MRLLSKPRGLILASLLCTMIAGCTGDDDAPPVSTVAPATTPTLPTTTPTPAVSSASSFFSTIAQRTAVTTNAALQFAVADSAAAHFVLHQASVRRLVSTTEPATAAATDAGFTICNIGGTCITYGNIEIDPASGLVSGFDINGIPVADRIVSAGLPATFEGGTAEVTSAYRSNSDELTIVVSIHNTSTVALTPFSFSATYLAPTATAAVETTSVWGPDTIPAASVAEILLVFADRPFGDIPIADTQFGGDVRMGALRSDGIDVLIEAVVPSR